MKLILAGLLNAAFIVLFALAPADAPPLQPATLTSDQDIYNHVYALETQVSDQSTLNSAMWGTLSSITIATEVATLTATGTPSVTATRAMPSTPTPAGDEPTATGEVLQASMTVTPTFMSATNSPTPTRTPVIATIAPITPTITPTPSELPRMVVATNVLGNAINIRASCSTSAERIGIVLAVDDPNTSYPDHQVTVDVERTETGEGYNWIWLWNGSGCLVHEKLQPYQMWLNWAR